MANIDTIADAKLVAFRNLVIDSVILIVSFVGIFYLIGYL